MSDDVCLSRRAMRHRHDAGLRRADRPFCVVNQDDEDETRGLLAGAQVRRIIVQAGMGSLGMETR